MYEVVLIVAGREEVLATYDNRLEAELRREQHIRSVSEGYVEIREAAAA
ncbi:MAG: hypothetical protein JW718_04980 [Desulfovibrionaceae bacterium]|nr:hypothetical protein [Desulfovibrionaceae bacterium]